MIVHADDYSYAHPKFLTSTFTAVIITPTYHIRTWDLWPTIHKQHDNNILSNFVPLLRFAIYSEAGTIYNKIN